MPRVAIVFEGSRGDCQPYIAAGINLRNAGFDVLLAGEEDSAKMCGDFGLPFVSYLPSARELLTDPESVGNMTKNDFFAMAKFNDKWKKEHPADFGLLWQKLQEFKPDIILGGAFTFTINYFFAAALGCASLPLFLQATVPSNYLSVLGVFPYFPPWSGMNKRLWLKLVREVFYKQPTKAQLPLLVKATGLSAEQFWPAEEDFMSAWYKEPPFPILMCASSVLNPVPKDFTPMHNMLGPQVIQTQDQKGSDFGGEDLEAMDSFLAAGEAPVYMGYGSISCRSGKWMTLLSLRALKLTGKRGILLGGFAGMDATHIQGEPDEDELQKYIDSSVLFMKTAPHGKLFPKCEVLVHHGGAGTLNASLRSGRPTIILPIIVDQFNHTKLVNEHGVGIGLPKMANATPKEIASAIIQCCESEDIIRRAKEFGDRLEKETQEAPHRLAEVLTTYYNDRVTTGSHMAMMQERRQLYKPKKPLRQRLSLACCCGAAGNVDEPMWRDPFFFEEPKPAEEVKPVEEAKPAEEARLAKEAKPEKLER